MRVLHGATRTMELADGHIEHDPANMSDRNVFLGLCGPRTMKFCEECGSNCGYIRQVRLRGIDLSEMHAHEQKREDRRLLRDRQISQRRRDEKKNGTDDT